MATEQPAPRTPQSSGADARLSESSAKRRRGIRKDWDRHVPHAAELAGTPAFQQLRDVILERAELCSSDRAVDIGTGTGLLALPLAELAATVWAIDISPAMIEFVRARAVDADLSNVRTLVAPATGLPLSADSVDLAVSNYCFHHLRHPAKHLAIAELFRVLAPGGRLVFGDMMFGWRPASRRDRQIVLSKVRVLAKRGPAGLFRLARAGLRTLTLSGEHPASPEWWASALSQGGFVDVSVEPLIVESGIAVARKPE